MGMLGTVWFLISTLTYKSYKRCIYVYVNALQHRTEHHKRSKLYNSVNSTRVLDGTFTFYFISSHPTSPDRQQNEGSRPGG